jgi:hypothetical protein
MMTPTIAITVPVTVTVIALRKTMSANGKWRTIIAT